MLLRRLLAMLIPLLTLVGVVGLLVLAMQHFEQGQRAAAALTAANAPQPPRYTLDTAEWTRYGDDGKPVFHIAAQTIAYYNDESAQLSNVTVDELGGAQGVWQLSAPQGTVPAGEHRILLGKPATLNGHLKNGTPVQLVSAHLWVDNTRQLIYSNDPVQMQSGTQRAQAVGMLANWSSNSVQLLSDVKMSYAHKPR
ncbi:MAG: LPS export ABC transporter periplasmic protein LptC [Stenotrophobium sp.]